MWSILLGVGVGVLEMVLLKKTISFVTTDKDRIVLGVFVSLGKMALVLVTLFLVAKFDSVISMVWCAGGIAAAMIGTAVIYGVRTIRQYKRVKHQGGES